MYSVVIPTHNRPDTLGRAVRSVLAQSLRPGEIIIVDDASNPPADLREFDGNEVPVVFVRCDHPGGAPRARNLGLSRAQYGFAAFLDDDDEWLPKKMEKQIAYLDRRPELVAVSCGRLPTSGDQESVEVFAEAFCNRYFWHDNLFGSYSVMTVRLDDRTKTVRMDPELRAGQDWDFWARLRESGDIGMVEEPLCRMHLHTGVRISTNYLNRALGWERFIENHKAHIPSGALRWIRSRIHFYRSHIDDSRFRRLLHVVSGVARGLTSDFPLKGRITHTGRHVLEVFFSHERTEALRVAFRRRFPRGW